MPDLDPTTAAVDSEAKRSLDPAAPPHGMQRRIVFAIGVLSLLLLLALLPPYINVNHYQRRIVTSISGSLGRPVHLDNITLNLLPLPSFTLENFVVDEDPTFGAEPIIRANTVTARLRASSLWRRRVEFSTISFQEPSVNLVHNPDGKWNLDSILLQASRVSSAPTSNKHPGPAPRFPYIEATGARINLKLGQEKTPFSLTDTNFALWLPDPGQWRFRLKGVPTRTDTDVSDTGRIELEASLGRAATLANVPLNLHAIWRSPPLGQTSRLLTGSDAGLRGEMALTAEAAGTVGQAMLHTHLHLTNLRRDQFVPDHPLTVDLDCLSSALAQFHTFAGIRCSWPVAGTDHGLVAMTGTVPDLRTPRNLDLQLGATHLPANTVLGWLRVATKRIPADFTATGYLNGTVLFSSASSNGEDSPWSVQATFGPLSIESPALGKSFISVGELNLLSDTALPSPSRHANTPPWPAHGVTIPSTPIALGGKDPAAIEMHFDRTGYRLHLNGPVLPSRVIALGEALPPLGEGLSAAMPTNTPATTPVRVDLTAVRNWGHPQTWADTSVAVPARSPAPRRSRRH